MLCTPDWPSRASRTIRLKVAPAECSVAMTVTTPSIAIRCQHLRDGTLRFADDLAVFVPIAHLNGQRSSAQQAIYRSRNILMHDQTMPRLQFDQYIERRRCTALPDNPP